MDSILNTLVQGNSDQFQSGSSFKSSFLEFTLSFALDGRPADLANGRRERERGETVLMVERSKNLGRWLVMKRRTLGFYEGRNFSEEFSCKEGRTEYSIFS